MWHQKWACHTAPFLEPMEAISVAVPKQDSMELGGQNWVPQKHKLRPKIGANFWAPLLTPFAYRVMLFQNTLIQPARLKQFQFFGVGFLSFRLRRACHNQAKLFAKCGTKNGPATQPHFWEPIGAILWPSRNKVQWWAKIRYPKNTNWDPKSGPIFEPLFWTICLPRDAISKYINPACQVETWEAHMTTHFQAYETTQKSKPHPKLRLVLFKKLHCWYTVENTWYVCASV